VDPLAVYDVQQIIRDLKQRGLGILITDHNVRETLSVVDRATSSIRARCSPRAPASSWSTTRRRGRSTWARRSACRATDFRRNNEQKGAGMDIQITGRNVTVNEGLRDYVDSRLGPVLEA
jgi:ABC-type sugar transport system ATPase subunit